MNDSIEVSQQAAREELGRFFIIADLADSAPEMFSAYIDAEWHRLLGSATYDTFCQQVVGHPVGHVTGACEGKVTWINLYHERFGTPPPEWFATATGQVDVTAYRRYLDTPTAPVITSWDCVPTTNDPDDVLTTTAPADPDFTKTPKPGLVTVS